MILIYYSILHHYRIDCDVVVRHCERMGKCAKCKRATGNHTYPCYNNEGDVSWGFLKSFLTLSIHILSLKGIFIQNRLSGAFQTRLFSYKEIWNSVYLLSCLVVAIDLEWRGMYIEIVLGSDLRGDEDRKESTCWVENVESYIDGI